MNRPVLLLAMILLILCAVLYFSGMTGPVMALLIAGVLAAVIAFATGR